MRLGIRRGWRIKLIGELKLYSSSLTHCLFLFTLLRVKAFRLRCWVVGYYISALFKKINIYAFIWRLPSISIIAATDQTVTWRIRGILWKRIWTKSRRTPVRFSCIPTKTTWSQTIKENQYAKTKLTKSTTKFIKIWNLSNKLLRFFNKRSSLTNQLIMKLFQNTRG